MDIHPQELFYNKISDGIIGAYIGMNTTPEQREHANRQGIRFFEYVRIIPNRDNVVNCPTCNTEMHSKTEAGRKLGWRYICPNMHRVAPTKGTLLDRVRINEVGSQTILLAMFHFIMDRPVTEFSSLYDFSIDSSVSWFQYFREIAQIIAWHDFEQLGGAYDIVEVDESRLFKRKYNVGRTTQFRNIWVFGGISRTTKRVFAMYVRRRNVETLFTIMQMYIDADSFICSDSWKAYRHCADFFAGYGRVNHTQNFLYPSREEEPVWFPNDRFHINCLDKRWTGPPPQPNQVPVRYHTQHVERMWRDLKQTLRSCTSLEHMESYIGWWMYKRNILAHETTIGGKFRRFCQDIRRVYPGIGQNPMLANMDNCRCIQCSG